VTAATWLAGGGGRRVPWTWFGWCAAALGLYLLGGWLGAAGAVMLPGFPIHPTNSIGSVASVFEHNLVVLAWISAGFLTLGLTTAAELFLNGTLLGFVALEMIERHQVPSLVTAVGPQLPLELGAYLIAAGATLRLGWNLWWPLLARRARRPLAWRAWLAAEGAAVTMLFAGAVVEVVFSHI
jgi:uncharacterized membrane protein SpoIIM required for sporulation